MSKTDIDTLWSQMSICYGQIGGGPQGIGNQETEGEDRGFCYFMPNDVSDATPMQQAPRVLVGMGGAEGPFGPEDSTHRDCINGIGIQARRDQNGNYFLERVISRYTGKETMGRTGATGNNQHLLCANPPTKAT